LFSQIDLAQWVITNFEAGVGDVAITYENEVLVAQKAGQAMELVIPSSTILIENPIALIDTYVDKHGNREVVEAFIRTLDPNLRLLITAQVDRKRLDETKQLVAGDERIELELEDLPRLEHLRRIAAYDVCVTPSRWEGLGLPLYEATAFGQPIVVNDNPPMNEVVTDSKNGLLVRGVQDGTAKSGIPAFSPDVAELASAFERLADPELRARLAEGARRRREELSWSRTVEGFRGLLERLGVATYAG